MGLLFVVESIVYCICLIIIAVRIFDGKFKKTTILFYFLLHFLLIVLALELEYDAFVICYALAIVILILLLKISIKGISLKLLSSIFLLLFSFNIILTSSVISFVLEPKKIDILIELIVHFLMLCVCVAVCYSKLLYKIKNILLWTSKGIKIIIIVLMLLSMIIMTLVFDIQEILYDNKELLTLYRIITISFVFIFLVLSVLVLNSITNMHLKTLTQNYERQIEAQAEHYAALSRANFELRRFRHDFNNIKVGVGELIAEGRQSEAVRMLDSANEDIYNTTDSLLSFDTGNGIVDALLADKQRNAASSNIKIEFEGAVPTNGISATELCVIFGNTIDNAIEACQKFDPKIGKIINVICRCRSGFMFLSITNPVNELITIKNNTVETTKTDKSLHGFGLYSLDKVVKKHSGELKLSCEDGIFKIDVNLSIE